MQVGGHATSVSYRQVGYRTSVLLVKVRGADRSSCGSYLRSFRSCDGPLQYVTRKQVSPGSELQDHDTNHTEVITCTKSVPLLRVC
jgi:hypothetical protein